MIQVRIPGLVPWIVCKIIFLFSDCYLKSGGDFLANMLPRLFFSSIETGSEKMPLFICVWLFIYFYFYICDIETMERKAKIER